MDASSGSECWTSEISQTQTSLILLHRESCCILVSARPCLAVLSCTLLSITQKQESNVILGVVLSQKVTPIYYGLPLANHQIGVEL